MSRVRIIIARIWDHREGLIALAVLAALIAAFRMAPILDPRIGYDGWSDLLYALTATIKMMIVAWGTWGCKVLYHGDTPDRLQWSNSGDIDADVWAVLVDRGEYAFWGTFWFCALFVV